LILPESRTYQIGNFRNGPNDSIAGDFPYTVIKDNNGALLK